MACLRCLRIRRSAASSRVIDGTSRPCAGPTSSGLARLDRRASHRAVGTAPRARSVDRPSIDGDAPYPTRPRRVPIAVSSPGGARQPGGHARPHGPGPAQFRRRRQRSAERLGDVQRRRQRRAAPRNDARGARHHPEAVDRGSALRLRRQILEGDQDGFDAGEFAPAYPAVPETVSADRRRRGEQGFGHVEARRRTRFFADEPQPQPRLCREPLGVGRRRSPPYRAHGRAAPIGASYARSSSPTATPRLGDCPSRG